MPKISLNLFYLGVSFCLSPRWQSGRQYWYASGRLSGRKQCIYLGKEINKESLLKLTQKIEKVKL